MTLPRRLLLLLLPLVCLPTAAEAACGLPANASAIYGYRSHNGERCHTLEEAEALLRSDANVPPMQLGFPIPGNIDQPNAGVVTLDYRSYGALGLGSSVLTGPPATLTSKYRAFVKNWPPASPLASCTIAGCDSQGCASPELETQRLQCQLDATWDNDPRFCWTRTAAATTSGTVTRFSQLIGAGTSSGALIFAPSSSTANNSGASISVPAQTCPARSEESATPSATQTFSWSLARQDNISCGAGGEIRDRKSVV